MPFFRKKAEKKSPASPTKSADSDATPPVVRNKVSPPPLINGDIGTDNGDDSLYGWGQRPKSLLLSPNPQLDIGGHQLHAQTPVFTSSRLSKTLQEILHDKDALPHFIQYMQSRHAGHIIKFWLDAESFQASSWTRIRSSSLRSQKSDTGSQRSLDNPSFQKSSEEGVAISGAEVTAAMLSNTASSGGQPSIGCTCSMNNTASSGATTPSPSCAAHYRSPSTSPASTSPSHYHSPISSGTDASPVPSLSKHPPDYHSQPHTDSGVTHTVTYSDNSGQSHATVTSTAEPYLPASSQPAATLSQDDSLQEKLRKSIEKDAVSIYSKYIAQDCSHPIGISDLLRNETISRICREDGQVDPACFEPCQEFVVKLMDKEYFPEFLQSEFHCKHQIDILTGSEVHLADVLYNEVALSYFMEFMDQEGAAGLLQCWLAMENFQQQLSEQHGHYDANEAQKDAMIIYEKYFSLQASNPLGFDDKTRFDVECNICREGGPLPDCFSLPKRQVLRALEKKYFPQFVKGELYLKYLTELINTIQLSADLPHIKRKRAGSDASSEHSSQSGNSEALSISSRNTLLAMESGKSSKNLKKALNMITDDMRIDTMLFNPDSLWLRPQSGHMSMGKVNEVGQFISELEVEPDKDSKTIGAIAANALFKKKADKEKTQEEMALKIAQKIIADVSNATQGIYGPEEEDY